MPTSTTPNKVQALPAVIEPDVTRLSALVDAGPEAISIVDGEWR